MRFEVNKYNYPNTTLIEDINYYGSTVPSSVEQVDLMDYILKDGIGNITYSIKNIDSTNALYYEASSLNLSCYANADSDVSLIDYFELNTTNIYLRFGLFVYDDDDELIYTGMISKDNIEINSVADNILDILIIGFEKEFSEYYKNKTLVISPLIPANTPVVLNYNGNKIMDLKTVLNVNFPNVTFDFDTDTNHFVRDWKITQKPYTYYPNSSMVTDQLFHFTSGYDCFVLDELSRYEFFNSLCVAMGWYWYFRAGILKIKKLSNSDSDNISIDCGESLISIGYSSVINDKTISNVMIRTGEYYGNETDDGVLYNEYVGYSYYLGAEKVKKYFEGDETSNSNRVFKTLSLTGIGLTQYNVVTAPHQYLKDYTEDNSDIMHKLKFVNTYTAAETDENQIQMKVNNTILLNPYICSRDHGGALRVSEARTTSGNFYGNGNFFPVNLDIDDNDIRYTGTVADGLLKYDSTLTKYIDYEYYADTEEFRDNMKTLLINSGTNIYIIAVKQLITDIDYIINLTNYSYQNFDSVNFLIQELSYNLSTGISELKLMQYV